MNNGQTYLMWIGSDFHKTIDEYIEHTKKKGISRKTINPDVAKALLNHTIYLAHDEGEKEECPDCIGEIDCPDCRKAQTQAEKLEKEQKELDPKAPNYEKSYRRLQKRIDKRQALTIHCKACKGTQLIKERGTGGYVAYNDGSEMDYRQYLYWVRQIDRWNPVHNGGYLEIEPCKTCGGLGTAPKGRIFGYFKPKEVVYVEGPDDSIEKLLLLKEKGIKIEEIDPKEERQKKEKQRRAQKGAYIVDRSKEALDLLPEPIEINQKRFRGIKKFSLGS